MRLLLDTHVFLWVEYILDQLGHGHTVEELIDGHPRLTRTGIEAAVRYAIEAVRAERVVSAAAE